MMTRAPARVARCKRAPIGARARRRQRPLVRRVARPVLEERPDRAAEVLGREQAAGHLGHALVGGARAALDLGPDDRLRRRVRPRRPLGQAPGERARRLVEALVGQHAVDDVPALERRGVVQLARHDELARPGGPGALGEPLRAAHRRRQADDGLDEAEPGRLGGEQEVARERRARTRPSGTARARRTPSAAAAPRRCGRGRAARATARTRPRP